MILKEERHKPFLYENEKSNNMVIFVHGILEGPNQFKDFANIVYKKGFSFSAILLPGHGESGKSFAKTSKNQWIDCLNKEICKYKDKHENIILVGHSMGCLLSTLLSSKHKDKIKGLVLISTPLKVSVKFNIMISSIKIALGIIKEDDTLTKKAYESFSVDRCSLLTYISWIPRYKDLFVLMLSAKKQLKNLKVPTLIVHTKNDELVSIKSLKIFEDKLRNDYEIINLKNSGHFYYNENELLHLLSKFDLFLNKLNL